MSIISKRWRPLLICTLVHLYSSLLTTYTVVLQWDIFSDHPVYKLTRTKTNFNLGFRSENIKSLKCPPPKTSRKIPFVDGVFYLTCDVKFSYSIILCLFLIKNGIYLLLLIAENSLIYRIIYILYDLIIVYLRGSVIITV